MSELSANPQFGIDIRVYFEDTDFGGVVYYANYLKFMERARTEYLRHLGYSQSQLFSEHRLMFVVRSANLSYIAPAVFDDVLNVSVKVGQVRRASVQFEQQCIRNNSNSDDELLVTGNIVIACVNADSFKPCAMPGNLKSVLDS